MNSSTRRRRNLKKFALKKYGYRCTGCGTLLTQDTATLDRYPIPGRLGGTYSRANVRPMCGPCNHSHIYEPGYRQYRLRQRAISWKEGSRLRKQHQPILTYKIRATLTAAKRKELSS